MADQNEWGDEDLAENEANQYDAVGEGEIDLFKDGGVDMDGIADEEDILDMGMGDAPLAMVDPESVLLMKFCPHDSSMLYPKEDKRNQKLVYACRLCRYAEEANHSIIYKNLLIQEVGNVLTKVPAAVSDDPTLPRSQKASCENCGHNEAVFFQSDTRDSRNDTLALVFVCCNCEYKWVG